MSTQTIHLKCRLMDSNIWVNSKKNLIKKILNQKLANLDQAGNNWHTHESTRNSPELLWMLSLYSSEIHLKKISRTELKIFANINSMQEYFREVYYFTRDLWRKEYPANILFTGADVIIKEDVDFSRISGFQMFNYASQVEHFRSRTGLRRNIKGGNAVFDQYLNCDVRYFSSDMDDSLWDIGDSWASNWMPNIWEYEQDLYNAMLMAQDQKSILIRPELAFQAPANEIRDDRMLLNWNKISIAEAKIVHLHSTRAPDKALELAKKLIFK